MLRARKAVSTDRSARRVPRPQGCLRRLTPFWLLPLELHSALPGVGCGLVPPCRAGLEAARSHTPRVKMEQRVPRRGRSAGRVPGGPACPAAVAPWHRDGPVAPLRGGPRPPGGQRVPRRARCAVVSHLGGVGRARGEDRGAGAAGVQVKSLLAEIFPSDICLPNTPKKENKSQSSAKARPGQRWEEARTFGVPAGWGHVPRGLVGGLPRCCQETR